MTDFHNFMMRHGEASIQYIVEEMERNQGVFSATPKSLEDRWNAIMQEPATPVSQMAA